MKSLARSYVWWPSLDGDIERIVHLCTPCQTRCNAPTVAPLHPWEWPSHPWARLHIDYAGPFFGKMFFVLVDAYSKWLEVKTLPAASAKTTIRCLQDIFATHGLPERIVSDNGSVFTSDEFRFFLKENGISHTTSSPYHPASNGLAERAVQSFKQSMRKSSGGSLEANLATFLFKYRLTPHATTSQAPAELLFQRRPRSRLDLLFPDIRSTVERKQFSQKQIHNHRSRVWSFSPQDPVFVRNFRPGQDRWIPARIIQLSGPVSARVQLANGEFQRRHFDHIRLRYKEEEEEDEQSYFAYDRADGSFDSYSPPEAPQKKPTAPVATSASKPLRRSSRARNQPAWFDPSSYP